MTAYILYSLAIIACGISFFKNKEKTKNALIKSVKSFENIMPQFLTIIVIVGLSYSRYEYYYKIYWSRVGIFRSTFFKCGRIFSYGTYICGFFYGKYFVKQWGRICPSGRISINSNFSGAYDFFTRIKIYWKEGGIL